MVSVSVIFQRLIQFSDLWYQIKLYPIELPTTHNHHITTLKINDIYIYIQEFHYIRIRTPIKNHDIPIGIPEKTSKLPRIGPSKWLSPATPAIPWALFATSQHCGYRGALRASKQWRRYCITCQPCCRPRKNGETKMGRLYLLKNVVVYTVYIYIYIHIHTHIYI